MAFGRPFFVIVGNPGSCFFIAIDVGGGGGLDFVFLIAAAVAFDGGGGGTVNILLMYVNKFIYIF